MGGLKIVLSKTNRNGDTNTIFSVVTDEPVGVEITSWDSRLQENYLSI